MINPLHLLYDNRPAPPSTSPKDPSSPIKDKDEDKITHFVFRKPLQNEKIRERYPGEHNELRRARDAGLIDLNDHNLMKRSLTHEDNRDHADGHWASRPGIPRTSVASSKSDSSGSIPPVPPLPPISPLKPKAKKSTIFDRNNVAVRMFKLEAQTEEAREQLKQQRKLDEWVKAEEKRMAEGSGMQIEGPFDHGHHHMQGLDSPPLLERERGFSIASSNASTTGTTSSSRDSVGENVKPSSSSKGRRFGILSKISASSLSSDDSEFPRRRGSASSRAVPRNMQPMNIAGIGGLSLEMYGVPRRRTTEPPSVSRSGSVSDDLSRARSTSTPSSYTSDARKLSHNSNKSRDFFSKHSTSPKEVSSPTWADKYVFGLKGRPKENYAKSIASRPVRRHSFASSERPSFTGLRRLSNASDGTYANIEPQEELPYGLTNGCDGSDWTPPSMLLLELFNSLTEYYGSTANLFKFAKAGELGHRRRSNTSSFVGWTESLNSNTPSLSQHPGTPAVFDDGGERAQMKSIMADRIWFLAALKWLYFGRVLFSPGHHLLQLGHAGTSSRPTTGDELRVLDLDGPMVADWSWHCAQDYPDAFIYTLTTTATSPELSPLTCEYMHPTNQRRVNIPSHTSLLSTLPPASFDVISSRNLPRFIRKSDWLPLLRECARLLKHDGYLELTVLDPVFNDMGPLTRSWVLDNVLVNDHPRTFDIMPSKTVLSHLEAAGLGEVNKVWMWMPATSIGDELSTVTSKVGRYLYDELYNVGVGSGEKGLERHVDSDLWKDEAIMKECMKHNTAFRWLKCHARKPDVTV